MNFDNIETFTDTRQVPHMSGMQVGAEIRIPFDCKLREGDKEFLLRLLMNEVTPILVNAKTVVNFQRPIHVIKKGERGVCHSLFTAYEYVQVRDVTQILYKASLADVYPLHRTFWQRLVYLFTNK